MLVHRVHSRCLLPFLTQQILLPVTFTQAKSKLKNPGLVYSYHGGNRKRDPKILAKNQIVVTTYETLASDATYHAKKGGDDYVPPCECVRWYRIICDECHQIRAASSKTSAVMSESRTISFF